MAAAVLSYHVHRLRAYAVKLKAELAAKESRMVMQQAKLLFQIITHPHCDHKHHDHQIDVPTRVTHWQYRKRNLAYCNSLGVSLDMRTQEVRDSASVYSSINNYLDQSTS
jgi:transcription elongation factor Elf1